MNGTVSIDSTKTNIQRKMRQNGCNFKALINRKMKKIKKQFVFASEVKKVDPMEWVANNFKLIRLNFSQQKQNFLQK